MRIWAPIGRDDEEASSLPCIQVEMSLQNRGTEPCTVRVRLQGGDLLGQGASPVSGQGWTGMQSGTCVLACDQESGWQSDPAVLEAEVTLAGQGERRLRFLVVILDAQGLAARRFSGGAELASFVYGQWDALAGQARQLEAALPASGYDDLDEILRWYLGAAVYLTKCTRDGDVLTMGYCELNQRDSYWTSWAHVVLWPRLERRMIEESATAMGPDGKVPTCILPRIERDDDLDINAYFVLRALRYVNYYQDDERLERWWPVLCRSADWLVGRAPDGLPLQGSFWGDWKDVAGVEGRCYSPHACLLYLAMLKRMVAGAVKRGDRAAHTRYQHAFVRGEERLNQPTSQGGLWNGSCYVQVWRDGRVDTRVLIDQCVGILFDVVAPEKARHILQALEASFGPHGTRETWPYYPDDFGYPGGTYHNGGVWPWLCFVEAWSRWRMGQPAAARERVRRVAHADLEASGDWLPHEYLHGETGENRGTPIQGWNGCLFGAIQFGLLGHGAIP